MKSGPTAVALASAVIIAALVGGVGLANGLVIRHIVQTLPLAVVTWLGVRQSSSTSWLALPCFLFWLVLMGVIWLYLLDVARIVNGHFTPIEIAMTLVVAAAAIAGIAAAARTRRSVSAAVAASLFAVGAVFQWACFRISMLDGIAQR